MATTARPRRAVMRQLSAKPGRSARAKTAAKTAVRKVARVRKNMDMDPDKLRRARKILGTKTDTETVDAALDIIVLGEAMDSALERLAAAGGLIDIWDGTRRR